MKILNLKLAAIEIQIEEELVTWLKQVRPPDGPDFSIYGSRAWSRNHLYEYLLDTWLKAIGEGERFTKAQFERLMESYWENRWAYVQQGRPLLSTTTYFRDDIEDMLNRLWEHLKTNATRLEYAGRLTERAKRNAALIFHIAIMRWYWMTITQDF